MCALFRDEFDPSKKAGAVLEHVLQDTSREVEEKRASSATVSEELKSESVISVTSDRAKSRVLFLTRDISVLEENAPLRTHLRAVASAFDEVHVVVLATIYEAKKGTVRDGTNMWLYTTGAQNTFDHFFATPKLIREQLVFSEGFRADIIGWYDLNWFPFLNVSND